MTEGQIAKYRKDAETGNVPDDKNPLFILSNVHTDLLVKIVSLDFNMVMLAEHELANRGLNNHGKYVGFSQTKPVKKSVKRRGRSL